MKNIDYLGIFVVVAIMSIWLSSRPWENPVVSLPIAGDIVKVGMGGILGYLAKGIVDTDIK
jgi:hypothetical protein